MITNAWSKPQTFNTTAPSITNSASHTTADRKKAHRHKYRHHTRAVRLTIKRTSRTMAPHATTVVSPQPLDVSLYAEIKAVIGLYAHDTNAPPFSPAELAVMAWVSYRNYQGIITEKQIFMWAVKKFKYFANFATEDAYNQNRYKKTRAPYSTPSRFIQRHHDRDRPPRRPNLSCLHGVRH